MRSRLEWFLGSALILLAAQLGFAAWHDHSAGRVAISPPWSVPGGRTFLCLYSLTATDRAPLLEVADRMETSIVDLQAHRRLPRAPKGYERRFVGAFVEEAYPLRFVPAQIESTCPSDR
jgi:hypothetical protein